MSTLTCYLYTAPTDDAPEIERTVEVHYDYTPGCPATRDAPAEGPEIDIYRVVEAGVEVEVTPAERDDLWRQVADYEHDRAMEEWGPARARRRGYL